jgi:hypothetical protein
MELGSMLMEDARMSATPWDDPAMVAQFRSESIQVNGFLYTADGNAIPAHRKVLMS